MFIDFLLWVALISLVVWFAFSWRSVKSDEVALRRFWGELEKKICKSGLVFLPRFWGVDLVRIPTKMFRLSYEGKPEHELCTKDRQLVLPDATFFLTFPYNDDEADSLIKIISKDVPLTEDGLQKWGEDILIPALWQVFRKMDHSSIIGGDDLDDINIMVNEILHKDGSPLRDCGVMGRNYQDTTPGTGRAFVQVETVSVTPELQKAMQARVVAKYQADAAVEIARSRSGQAGGEAFMNLAKARGMTLKALMKDLKEHPEKLGKSLAEGGYAEDYEWARAQATRDVGTGEGVTRDESQIDISTGNEPITDPDFRGAVAIAGAIGAAVRLGKGGKSNGRGKNPGDGPRKPFSQMTDDEKQELAQRYKKNKGKGGD